MFGKRVFGVVDGNDPFGFQVLGDASQFLGHRVDMFPVFAVLSVFQYCQVYPGIVFPDFQEMFVVTAVPSEINIPGKRFQQERCV